MDMVTLRNLTKQELPVPGTAGEQVFGIAGTSEAELALDTATAEDVLELYGRERFEIVDIGAIAATYVPEVVPQTMWVANMTGNPDAPSVVDAGKMKNRETNLVEVVRVENVNRQPRPIRMEMKGAQGSYKDGEGNNQGYIALPTIVEIPAYQRRELDIPIAKWMINRDNMAPVHERGALMKSRDHGEFEPNADWTIDELHAYLGYVDPMARKQGLCAPDEATLESKFTGKKLEAQKRQVKLKAMKRLHFRLADPKYRLPSEQEFQSYMKSRETGEWTDASGDQEILDAFMTEVASD